MLFECVRKKIIGKPCEGEPHARFEVAGDGNDDTAPLLDPTLVCPSSGKDIANGKGVVSNCESEGSRTANFRSDEQKSHQATVKDKTAIQVKVQ